MSKSAGQAGQTPTDPGLSGVPVSQFLRAGGLNGPGAQADGGQGFDIEAIKELLGANHGGIDTRSLDAMRSQQNPGGPQIAMSGQGMDLTPYSRSEGRTTGPTIHTGPVDAATGAPAMVQVTPQAPQQGGFPHDVMSILGGGGGGNGGGSSFAAQGAEGARQARLANSKGQMYAPSPLQKKPGGGLDLETIMKMLAGA